MKIDIPDMPEITWPKPPAFDGKEYVPDLEKDLAWHKRCILHSETAMEYWVTDCQERIQFHKTEIDRIEQLCHLK